MKKSDPLIELQQKLEALQEEEKALEQNMKSLAQQIQQNATPMGIAKGVASKVFSSKGGVASTATAALGIGASLMAGNIVRKQQRLSLIGKAVGLASGLLMTQLAKRRERRQAQKDQGK